MLFFFFKQKTADEMRISDWSSDVCSSDLHLYLRRGVVDQVGKGRRRTDTDEAHRSAVVEAHGHAAVELRLADRGNRSKKIAQLRRPVVVCIDDVAECEHVGAAVEVGDGVVAVAARQIEIGEAEDVFAGTTLPRS